MLKFKIINSSQKISKDTFLKLVQENPHFPHEKTTSLKTKGTYSIILVENDRKKIVGGAYLLKKNKNAIQEELHDLLSPLNNEPLWECLAIYLEASSESSILAIPEKTLFVRKFLYGLYKKFVEFGEDHRINFVLMKLRAETYELTKKIGEWPYVVEIDPSLSGEGVFYGVLPLSGSQYKAYIYANKNL